MTRFPRLGPDWRSMARGAENGDAAGRRRQPKYQPQVGDLVFAKVEPLCPNGRKAPAGKFAVFFFGTYESAVLFAKELVPYEANIEKHGKGARHKDFATGMREIAESPDITGRPAADPHPGLVSETICETKGSGQPLPDFEQRSESSERAVAVTPLSAAENSPMPPLEKALVTGSERKKRSSKKRKNSESDDSASNKETKTKEKRTSDKGSKSKRVKEEAVAEPMVTESVATDTAATVADSDKVSDIHLLQKLKAKAEKKQRKKEQLKAEKMLRKRQERLNQLKSQPVTEAMLREVEAEIVESLSVEVRDAPRAVLAMGRLDVMAVTPEMLVACPQILVTIRKCRKYIHDEHVRQKADYLHNKFRNLMSESNLNKELAEKLRQIHMTQHAVSSAVKTKSETSAVPTDCPPVASSSSSSPSADAVTTTRPQSPSAPVTAAVLTHKQSEAATVLSSTQSDGTKGDEPDNDTPVPDIDASQKAANSTPSVAEVTPDLPANVSPAVAAVVQKLTDTVAENVNGETDTAAISLPVDSSELAEGTQTPSQPHST